jgi:hypothetical protein
LRGFLERIERQYGKARRIWLGRVFLDEVGAQEIPAFARAGLPQLIAIEAIAVRRYRTGCYPCFLFIDLGI